MLKKGRGNQRGGLEQACAEERWGLEPGRFGTGARSPPFLRSRKAQREQKKEKKRNQPPINKEGERTSEQLRRDEEIP